VGVYHRRLHGGVPAETARRLTTLASQDRRQVVDDAAGLAATPALTRPQDVDARVDQPASVRRVGLLLLGLVRRAAQEAHSRVEPNATTGVSPQSGRVCGSVA
jgi:hypothetical protein